MQTTTNQEQLNQAGAAVPGGQYIKSDREKYWRELTTAEKIERMRLLVKHLVSQVDGLRREAGEIKEMLWNHAHEENGKTVIVISKQDRYKIEKSFAGLTAVGKVSENSEDFYI